jgi:hypothetical protein
MSDEGEDYISDDDEDLHATAATDPEDELYSGSDNEDGEHIFDEANASHCNVEIAEFSGGACADQQLPPPAFAQPPNATASILGREKLSRAEHNMMLDAQASGLSPDAAILQLHVRLLASNSPLLHSLFACQWLQT